MPKYRIPSDYQNQVSKANHNWSTSSGGTIHPGLAYPIKHRHLNTGDRFRGKPEILVQSEAMEGPLLNGFKLVTIATFTPDSVLYGWMRNGTRFSPDEYTKFSKFVFNPLYMPILSEGSNEYIDPVFGKDLFCTPLELGLDKTDTYGSWVDDVRSADHSRFTHIGRGGLWDWLGVPPGTVAPIVGSSAAAATKDLPAFRWNLSPVVAYFLSCYYYIANMQEDYMYFTDSAFDISVASFEKSMQLPFDQIFCSLDVNDALAYITSLNSFSTRGAGGDINKITSSQVVPSDPFLKLLYSGLGGHGGLFSVPYSPDLFGNIIKQGTSPTAYVDVETSSEHPADSIAVPELRLQTKIQNMLDRLFVSGGRFGDVLRTLWGTKSSPYVNKPDFLGVWQSSINPSNVVASASGSADGLDVNLGQMAARVDRYSDFRGSQGVDYYAKEPGTLMFITMLVPQPSYAQGLNPDLATSSFADDYNPELAGIGFQSVPRHRFSLMPNSFIGEGWIQDSFVTIDPNQVSVGDEVAWSWLRTDYPTLHGEFAQNGTKQYWTLVRRFTETYVYGVKEPYSYNAYNYYGTYINPLSWQYLFAGQTLFDPNFIVTAQFNQSVTSSLPAGYMPYLGR